MAGILNEYLDKKLNIIELQKHLEELIREYNQYTGRYLMIYAADLNKAKQGIPDLSMDQDDFYNIQDILRESLEDKIDIYIETPGGSGETAEEIARFLHKKFDEVNFIIASEAKSAGTVLVMSGDDIYMTDTGSLGPIDAQTRIGRSWCSAYDYKEWIDKKREEAIKNRFLNPVDAQIIAQITPGELSGVVNALEFAKDLVSDWLIKYKFKDWNHRKSTGLVVTEEYKTSRAREVATKLCNHSLWRSHGRSLKIEDFEGLLQIKRIDDDETLANIVYRIKIVLKLIFGSSTIYKIYRTSDTFLAKNAVLSTNNNNIEKIPIMTPQQKEIKCTTINIKCSKCGKNHMVKGYLGISKEDIKKFNLDVNPNIDDNENLICDVCGLEIDLKPVKTNIEQIEKQVLTLK